MEELQFLGVTRNIKLAPHNSVLLLVKWGEVPHIEAQKSMVKNTNHPQVKP